MLQKVGASSQMGEKRKKKNYWTLLIKQDKISENETP
jgi:hypothetical protein